MTATGFLENPRIALSTRRHLARIRIGLAGCVCDVLPGHVRRRPPTRVPARPGRPPLGSVVRPRLVRSSVRTVVAGDSPGRSDPGLAEGWAAIPRRERTDGHPRPRLDRG